MPKGVYKKTKEHKKHIGNALRGKKKTLEHRQNLSKYHANVSGKNNPRWAGGKLKRHGYWLIHKPNHPFCNKNRYVFEKI